MRLEKLTANSTWRSKHNFRTKGVNGCADMKGMPWWKCRAEVGATLQQRKVNWPIFSPSGPPLKLWAMGVGRTHIGRAWVRVTHSRSPQLCLSAKAREC